MATGRRRGGGARGRGAARTGSVLPIMIRFRGGRVLTDVSRGSLGSLRRRVRASRPSLSSPARPPTPASPPPLPHRRMPASRAPRRDVKTLRRPLADAGWPPERTPRKGGETLPTAPRTADLSEIGRPVGGGASAPAKQIMSGPRARRPRPCATSSPAASPPSAARDGGVGRGPRRASARAWDVRPHGKGTRALDRFPHALSPRLPPPAPFPPPPPRAAQPTSSRTSWRRMVSSICEIADASTSSARRRSCGRARGGRRGGGGRSNGAPAGLAGGRAKRASPQRPSAPQTVPRSRGAPRP